MRRSLAVATALLVVPAAMALPVVTFADDDRDPVTPTVRTLALTSVDPRGLLDSPPSDQVLPVIGSPTEPVVVLAADEAHDDHEGDDHGRDPSIPLEPAAATPRTDVEPFGLVGLTAQEPFDPDTRVLIRIREDGQWTEWAELPVGEHLPDPDTEEGQRARYATEPLVTTGADGVQVRVDTPDGEVPADTELTMIDNPVVPQDANLGATTLPMSSAQAEADRPAIVTRAQWGANESLRRGTPSYSPAVKVAFVHHVVSSNDYSEAQAAQQMRNVYSWFTQGIGVNDFGYNFMVDRFGRIYEGRAGGVDLAVIGAHTSGFNAETFAVSFLGNADTLNPGRAEGNRIVGAMADVIAWKFGLDHVNPQGNAVLTSAGPGPGQGTTSKYWPGERVTSPTIAGHGDIGSTSCPGEFLRPHVPRLRAQVATLQGATFFVPRVLGSGSAWGSDTPIRVTARTTAPVAGTLDIVSACGDRVRTLRASTAAAGSLDFRWDGKDSRGAAVPPGRYTVTLNASAGAETLSPWTDVVRIVATPTSPVDPCSPPEQFTVTGTGYGHGVGLSQWGALGMARAGRSATQIVEYYYPGVSVGPHRDDAEVRIGLLHQVATAQARTESLESGGGGLELTLGQKLVTGVPGASYAFSVNRSHVRVRQTLDGKTTNVGRARKVTLRWSGTRDPGAAGTAATLLNVVGPGESFTSANHRYRYGTVELSTVSSSAGRRLAVVNVLRLRDEYLRGIAEVVPSWPQAALRSQVIASRSYALSKVAAGTREACKCHMDDGGGPYYDQVFRGYVVEFGDFGDNWVRAVEATLIGADQGETALYRGVPIPAFYTAATGGRTTAASDVWGGAGYPWAVSVDDRWSVEVEGNPYREWSVQATQARMAAIFGVQDIMTVAVSGNFESGSARRVTATTQTGKQVWVSGTAFRSALGLRSTYLTRITGLPTGTPTPTPTPAPTGTVTMFVRPTGAVVEGSDVTLQGRVKDMRPGLAVQRQVRFGSVDWQNRERVSPDAEGRYSFVLPKVSPKGMTYSWRVLVYDGTTIVAVGPIKSKTIT